MEFLKDGNAVFVNVAAPLELGPDGSFYYVVILISE